MTLAMRGAVIRHMMSFRHAAICIGAPCRRYADIDTHTDGCDSAYAATWWVRKSVTCSKRLVRSPASAWPSMFMKRSDDTWSGCCLSTANQAA
jgi:hypothetical protein